MTSKRPAPEERVFTVRWTRSRACLAADPTTTWRWSEPSQAALMTLAEAEAAQARMGGVVCVEGVPLDKLDVVPPKKPAPVKAPKKPGVARAEKVADLVAAQRWRDALQAAVKLRGLGDEAKTLERALDGYVRPDFCRQLKRDPEALIQAGIEILKRRWPADGSA